MGKILSIDYGLKRVGLAYCEDSIMIAHPLKTISTFEIWQFLKTYYSENNVHTVVLGQPKKLDTTSTDLSPRSVVTVAVVPIATPSHLIVPAAASHVMDCP